MGFDRCWSGGISSEWWLMVGSNPMVASWCFSHRVVGGLLVVFIILFVVFFFVDSVVLICVLFVLFMFMLCCCLCLHNKLFGLFLG